MVAIIRNIAPITIKIAETFMHHTNHFSKLSPGIIPIVPINRPDVGMSALVNPSPNWNAVTAIWRDIPRTSAAGAMSGITI